MCYKTCARPGFARVRTADPSKCPRAPSSKNASPGEQAEAPRRRWKPGQEQHPGPENQDSTCLINLGGLSLIIAQERGTAIEGIFKRYFEIGDHPKKVLSNPPEGQKGISTRATWLFLCLGQKKGRKKTRAQPWYARKSGKSPGQEGSIEPLKRFYRTPKGSIEPLLGPKKVL